MRPKLRSPGLRQPVGAFVRATLTFNSKEIYVRVTDGKRRLVAALHTVVCPGQVLECLLCTR